MSTCGWLGQGSHADACPWPVSAMQRIEWLCEHGSSLDLNWDSDAEMWEVAWITLGERHTVIGRWQLYGALQRVYDIAVLGLV